MEIHILQAGEHLGPFSENEVRQALGSGLVAPSDLAICEGVEIWQPVDRLLSQLTPHAAPSVEMTHPEIAKTEPPAPQSLAPTEPPSELPDEPTDATLAESASTESTPAPSAENATASGPLPANLTSSQALAQKTKRKLGKIVLQPILPLEPASTLPVIKKKSNKTGKTALTMEPLRPTTALPPVTGFAPKEKKATGKTVIKTGQLTFGDFGEKPAPLVTPPAAAAPTPASATTWPVPSPASMPAAPAPLIVQAMETGATGPLLPPTTRLLSRDDTSIFGTWYERLPREVLYASALLAFIIFCVISTIIYLIVAQHGGASTGALNPDTGPPALHASVPPPEPKTAAEFSTRALARQMKGDLDGAIKDYNQALSLDPKNALIFFQRGLARQTTGDANGAFADYTTALSFDPRMADAYSNRAYIKQARNDLNGAFADYQHALQFNPKISAAYFNMGLIQVQKGDLDGAIADYNRAIDLSPKMDIAYYNRGVAKSAEGNLDGAIADYTQAITLNPNLARAFCARGFSRQSRDDADGALADYTQALALNPKLEDAFYNRGLIRMQQSDFAGAIDDNTQAIALNPKNGAAYFNRGLALFGQGNLNDAQADLNQFCEQMPKDAGTDSARLYLWLIATEQNPKGTADRDLTAQLHNDWNSPPEDLTSKIGNFLAGHMKESELIANAASPDPTHEPGQYCEVWYFAGMKRLFNGDTTRAISHFQKSLATNQKNVREYIFSQAQLKALAQSRQVSSNGDGTHE